MTWSINGTEKVAKFLSGESREKRNRKNKKQIRKKKAKYSLVHIKITASVTKSLHQDFDLCYLHFPNFSFTYTLLVCSKIKSCCDHCFPQQFRPQNAFQLYILLDYSSGRIGFNMNNKHLSLPLVCIMLIKI